MHTQSMSVLFGVDMPHKQYAWIFELWWTTRSYAWIYTLVCMGYNFKPAEQTLVLGFCVGLHYLLSPGFFGSGCNSIYNVSGYSLLIPFILSHNSYSAENMDIIAFSSISVPQSIKLQRDLNCRKTRNLKVK